MFKLETDRLKRDFKITDDNFYASQILNTYSNMSFVPDGNGSEFVIRLQNGKEFSAKGLKVVNSVEQDGKIKFDFAENMGIAVTLEYWVHNDGNSICKQITVNQTSSDKIDYILLENVGIINSKTHFSVDLMPDGEISGAQASLGQPFYVDSLFFGSEFPGTENRIVHGAGQIKYYVGKVAGTEFKCPVTVTGAAKGNSFIDVKNAFFEYIDFISQDCSLKFQYNSWFDTHQNIDENILISAYKDVANGLAFHNAPKLDTIVVDDGWQSAKAKFWQVDAKKFPNGLEKISAQCKALGCTMGLWLSPRGGYNQLKKFAKKIQRGGNGYFNKEAGEICVASQKYVKLLEDFLTKQVTTLDLSYLKLDGFCKAQCQDESHDHLVGGENNLYYTTDMYHKWIELFTNLRAARADKPLWINMTCYVNVSPWWLQWVNSLWLQNSSDVGFSDNCADQPQVESALTYRDARYYDCVCRRANQIPLKNIFNHELIYAKNAETQYTDKDFEKAAYWNVVRGQALNELYISPSMMDGTKWESLAAAMNFQKDNFDILQNATYIGGDPEDNNIYGYISWQNEGNGIIALRNPTNEKTALTLNLNKLMGTPESLANAKCEFVFKGAEHKIDDEYSYADKIDLTLAPFEVVILKFTK